MKAPFPWFGGKRRVAHEVWARLGACHNYVEPFAGSLAVMLARPDWPFKTNKIETVNDVDCYIANAWRSISLAPDEVAKYADNPVNEADLHARHRWLYDNKDFRKRMRTEPEYHDCKVAGWWLWGICSWIGSNWCSDKGLLEADVSDDRDGPTPHLGNSGQGVNRALRQKKPHMGDSGRGVNRALRQPKPHMSNRGVERVMNGRNRTCDERLADLTAYMGQLRDRLRFVRVCCGDWTRVLTPSVTSKHGITGVFLDPPYSMEATEQQDVYSINSNDGSMTRGIQDWCAANGHDHQMRIALCGYAGEYDLPGWDVFEWVGSSGMGRAKTGNANRLLERIWFSPACRKPICKKEQEQVPCLDFEWAGNERVTSE